MKSLTDVTHLYHWPGPEVTIIIYHPINCVNGGGVCYVPQASHELLGSKDLLSFLSSWDYRRVALILADIYILT